jgi:cupin superfamily acireductone dioxygenase involved in methionine salvage
MLDFYDMLEYYIREDEFKKGYQEWLEEVEVEPSEEEIEEMYKAFHKEHKDI